VTLNANDGASKALRKEKENYVARQNGWLTLPLGVFGRAMGERTAGTTTGDGVFLREKS
jgi:hypothetical protein